MVHVEPGNHASAVRQPLYQGIRQRLIYPQQSRRTWEQAKALEQRVLLMRSRHLDRPLMIRRRVSSQGPGEVVVVVA